MTSSSARSKCANASAGSILPRSEEGGSQSRHDVGERPRIRAERHSKQSLRRRCDPGEPSGALGFDYVLWMQYDPDSGWLIEGNCLHPVTGGSGDFAGARGVLTMLAGPVGRGEQINSTYKGEIVLNAIPNERAVLQNDDAPAGSAVRAAGC